MNTEEFNFDDLTPIPVDDDGIQDVILCKIMYSEEFKTVFGYLRRLMADNELTGRAMYVACKAIQLVPAHYTVWEYKFRIVTELVKKGEYTLAEELEWCSNIALNNEKNYQIWHYRENVIELMIETTYDGVKGKYDLESEYTIIENMLDNDDKNYHVWSHKRWLVQYFELFRSEKEISYLTKLIEADVRNNSAWNFKHFVVFGDDKSTIPNLQEEVEFTVQQIERSITNPSSWNYIKFLYNKCVRDVNTDKTPELDDLVERIKNIVFKYSRDVPEGELDMTKYRVSVPAFELLATVYKDAGDSAKQKDVYQQLATLLDPVRRHYWALQQAGVAVV